MKTKIFALVLLIACFAQAKQAQFSEAHCWKWKWWPAGGEEPPMAGFKDMALGSDPNHKQQRPMLCQEYVLQSERVEYRIRSKDEKHPVLLPVGQTAEFRLKKDKMLLRVTESDSKTREYYVISMSPWAHKEEEAVKAAKNPE